MIASSNGFSTFYYIFCFCFSRRNINGINKKRKKKNAHAHCLPSLSFSFFILFVFCEINWRYAEKKKKSDRNNNETGTFSVLPSLYPTKICSIWYGNDFWFWFTWKQLSKAFFVWMKTKRKKRNEIKNNEAFFCYCFFGLPAKHVVCVDCFVFIWTYTVYVCVNKSRTFVGD